MNKKKITYILKRVLKTVVYSLFSKRTLFMIIIALVIMLLHLNVNAESDYEDGYAYRYVSTPEYDTTIDSYKYSYRIFTVNGLLQGEFYLPSTMYNNDIWIVSVGNDGVLYYWNKISSNSSETLYLNRRYTGTDGRLSSSFTKTSDYLKIDRYIYDFETDTWGSVKSINSDSAYGLLTINNTPFGPDNILITKNCSIMGHDRRGDGNLASYIVMRDNKRLKTPTLVYYPDTGFRLYLNDFIPYDSNDYEDLNLGYSTVDTVSILFAIYDMDNHEYILNNYSLQLQDIDDEGNYYIDLPFYDGTTLASNIRYMVDNGGDYLLFFGTNLTNNKCVDGMNSSAFTVTTLYNSLDYFRFKYYTSSGSGILTSVYADGTEKPNQNGSGGDETETTDNQTANAINNLNNSINNQTTKIEETTNAIQEQTEVQRNIFQKILDLPRSNY